ncbi:hypothetical protein Pan216_38770 [Planctomycetes bacterium Pan216]|uniref:Uncharacterized protein n=1 Tax=Kolteria novifilia TaxID=2527975 RepID=A0A518B7S2_9BACT|nr:hypothetical protein Pan216_38770 [Planctomycetes bacterium Pan216]
MNWTEFFTIITSEQQERINRRGANDKGFADSRLEWTARDGQQQGKDKRNPVPFSGLGGDGGFLWMNEDDPTNPGSMLSSWESHSRVQ